MKRKLMAAVAAASMVGTLGFGGVAGAVGGEKPGCLLPNGKVAANPNACLNAGGGNGGEAGDPGNSGNTPAADNDNL